jgi:hypothetical protein
MTPRILDDISTWFVDWSLITIMGNTMPPRDPDDDDDEDEEDEEDGEDGEDGEGEEDGEDEEDEDRHEEPPVVRETPQARGPSPQGHGRGRWGAR